VQQNKGVTTSNNVIPLFLLLFIVVCILEKLCIILLNYELYLTAALWQRWWWIARMPMRSRDAECWLHRWRTQLNLLLYANSLYFSQNCNNYL